MGEFIVGVLIIWGIVTLVRRRNARNRNVPARANNQSENVVVVSSGNEVVGPVIYYADSVQGAAEYEYRFQFEHRNNEWRAYILSIPSFNGRDEAMHLTHRLSDGNRTYICWDSPIRTIDEMKAVARRWSNALQLYIHNGTRF